MQRDRLILACAAVLIFGLWISWRSVSGVDAGAPAGDAGPSTSHAEEGSSPALILDQAAAEPESKRAPAIVEPTADARLPVLVAGIVVDDHEVPVESASVYVSDEEGEGRASRGGHGRPLRSDASGRFQVRGLEKSLRLRVSASKPGYFDAEPVSFERGANGVHLVLRRGGVVAGRVLVDPGIPMDMLQVRLEGGANSHPRQPSADGGFNFDGLDATTAKIAVTIKSDDLPVVEIDSIRVRQIGEDGDPRLDPLDLRGILELLAVDVQDDAGKKCSGATVVLSDASRRFGDRGRVTQDGRATFLTPTGTYDVDVDRVGWRRAHLSGVQSDQVVQLKRGMPVRVILDGSGELPVSPYRLVVALLVDVQRPRSVVDGMGAFAAGRETTLLASSPGLHDVAWYLESGTRQTFLVGTPRRIVELRDSDEEQVIHVDLAGAVRESWEATIWRLESEAGHRQAQSEEPRAAWPRPRASASAEPRPR